MQKFSRDEKGFTLKYFCWIAFTADPRRGSVSWLGSSNLSLFWGLFCLFFHNLLSSCTRWPTTLVRLGLRSFPGYETFSAKTSTALNKPERLITVKVPFWIPRHNRACLPLAPEQWTLLVHYYILNTAFWVHGSLFVRDFLLTLVHCVPRYQATIHQALRVAF